MDTAPPRANDLPEIPEPPSGITLREAADVARCEIILHGAPPQAPDLMARLNRLLEAPTRSEFIGAAKSIVGSGSRADDAARKYLGDLFDMTSVSEMLDAVPVLRVEVDDAAYADALTSYVRHRIRSANLRDPNAFIHIWPGLVELTQTVVSEAAIARRGAERAHRLLAPVVTAGLHHAIALDNPGMSSLIATHAIHTQRIDGLGAQTTGAAWQNLGRFATIDAYARTCIGLASAAFVDRDAGLPDPEHLAFAEQITALASQTAEALAELGLIDRARMALRVALQTEQGLRTIDAGRSGLTTDLFRARLLDFTTDTRGLEP